MAHGAEEVRAHIDSQHVYKHGKSETLGKLQHVRVDGESEMARHDAHEEDEGDAEGDTFYMELAEGKSQSTDQWKNDDALHRRMHVD